jgi:hypothetical protein
MFDPGEPAPARPASARDRHGRGVRGPTMLAGPLTPHGPPRRRSRRDHFDAVVLDVLGALEARWSDELGLVEFAVEETPVVPEDWTAPTVPLGSLIPGTGSDPTRVVLFRRPIEMRCETQGDLGALVYTVLVEQVAELLGRRPEDIDPREG